MNQREREALEAAGFRIGDAEDLLELTAEERRLVELRVAISRAIRARREQMGLTQQEVAKILKTSQPRVAMIEAGASNVSLDSMFRGLFVLGGGLEDLRARHTDTFEPPQGSPEKHASSSAVGSISKLTAKVAANRKANIKTLRVASVKQTASAKRKAAALRRAPAPRKPAGK